MRLKEESSEQKLRGAYYTPLPLAEMMVKIFSGNKQIKNALEPSCGDGVFLDAMSNTGIIDQFDTITAIEIEDDEAIKVQKRYESKRNLKVINQDFFDYYEECSDKKYDLILGNPPYIRYQYLEEEQRALLSDILTSQGMKANKLINAWVGFMAACVNMLSDQGKIVFVIPAEILQVVYAEDLRLFLSNNLSKISIITFEELVFSDIEQEVVVFIGEKGEEEKGIRIIELNNLDDLKNFDINSNGFQKLQHVHEKWTKYFTTDKENELVSEIRNNDLFHKLSDCALINVGITTGNNKYFSVDKNTVEKYELESVVRPLIGRSSHANSIFFTQNDWMENVNSGKAAYLIDFPETPYDEYPDKHKEYIELGEEQEENKGYKCSIRDRWYRIPSIWVPDAFFLRRNNLYPKFVLNRCEAVSTDTMHRIKFNDGVSAEKIMLSYYNSISFAFTELCGRSYGGGVLEILPGEVGNIYVPKLDNISEDKVRSLLEKVDDIVRRNDDITKALDLVDDEILVTELGISKTLCNEARGIWKKLQKRRLKRS
ncbi:MAG: class I SAM-dependent methyltransferase [Lachnospiraceae bacterium]|nr:class I SAM-dependent methyltransferase [Lachnospiraceae bacterium]